MRLVEVEDGLRVRFASRSAEFDQGLEVGIAAAMMASGAVSFDRTVAPDTVEPIRILAQQLHYRVVASPAKDGRVRVTVMQTSSRPTLRVVAAG